MYKPLPPSLTIKPSLVQGLGLFATCYIPAGTDLGLCHKKTRFGIFRTPLGGFYNYGDDPNCVKEIQEFNPSVLDSSTYYNLVTIKNISTGEEILVTYTFYKIQQGFTAPH